jgi:hypothetical protein
LTAEQQAALLDRISTGRCPYPDCGGGASHHRRATWLVASLTLPVAVLRGPTRAVTFDVRVCDFHAR